MTGFFRSRRLLIMVIVLMALALALRLWYLQINPLWPQFSNADDGDYYGRALRFAATGQYIDDSWLIRPPFHVWIFAGWIKLALLLNQAPSFGVQLIQGFQVALGVLMVPLCYALGSRLFNRRAGLLFAAFWAIWFPFVELPATLFSEPIYLVLFTLHLWLLVRFDDHGRYRDLALSGVVLGMAALTRSPALYALVFAIPWLIWKNEGGRTKVEGKRARSSSFIPHPSSILRALKSFAVLAACTLAVVLPWTIRNYLEYRHVIPVDTLGPINLWLDLGAAGERNEKIEQLRKLPQADRQGYAAAQVRAMLAEEPLRPFRNVWPTFRHVWKAQYVEDFWVKRSFFTRPLREAAPLGLFGDAIWLLISLAGVVGVLHPRTDRAFKLLTGLWLLYSFVTVLVFHVEPRYLLSIWLLLGLYAAWTLSVGVDWVRSLRPQPLRAGLVGASVIALLWLIGSYRDYPAIVARGVARESYMVRGDRAYAAGEYATAEREYRAALTSDPGFIDGEVALALALGAQGRPAEGIDVLTPNGSRRSVLVAGALRRMAREPEQARDLLATIEQRAGEDAQRWALQTLPAELRNDVVLGDGLDLGYIAGFSGAELSGARSFRWLQGDGEIVLWLDDPLPAGAVVKLELAAPLPLDGPLRIGFDDGTTLSLTPDGDWRAYRVSVPMALAGQSRLRLRLRAPTYLPLRADAASADPRALSVMVHRVVVERE